MKRKSIPLFCGLLLIGSFGACRKAEQTTAPNSDKAVLLKIKWPVGNRYVYRMDLDQHSTNRIPQMPEPMQQNVTMGMTYALSVLKESAGEGPEVEMEFLASEIEVKMGPQVVMSFDSKESSDNDGQNPFIGPYRRMIGSKLRIQMDRDGGMKEIIGLDQWLDTVTAGAGGQAKGMMAQQFSEGYFRQIVDFGRGLPKNPVKAGDSWPLKIDVPLGPMGKLSTDSTITFKGWEDHGQHKTVALGSSGTFKGSPAAAAGPMGKVAIEKGTGAGTSWFDPELGALIETAMDQTMHMKGELPGQPDGNQPPPQFSSDIGQKVTVKLVELGKAKQ